MYKTTNTFISYSILDTEKQGLTRFINKITIWIQMVNKRELKVSIQCHSSISAHTVPNVISSVSV